MSRSSGMMEPDDNLQSSQSDYAVSAVAGDETKTVGHIEISLSDISDHYDIYTKLVAYFKKLLGHEGQTTFAQSYDSENDLFRFDFSCADIKKLMEAEHELLIDGKRRNFTVKSPTTGSEVQIRCDDSHEMEKEIVYETFGEQSSYKSDVTISSIGQREAILKFAKYSVAARFVHQEWHELMDGLQVKASFIADSDCALTSEDTDRFGVVARTSSEEVNKGDYLTQQTSSTLLISNLVDVDHQTVYFWVKSLLNVWPLSVQLSMDEERAMVMIPATCNTEEKLLQEIANSPDFHLHGEKLSIKKLPPVTNIQVIVPRKDKGSTTMDDLALETCFSSTRHTGIENDQPVADVQQLHLSDGRTVYSVTYHDAKDAARVLQRSQYFWKKWKFDVAAYYPELGLCSPDGTRNYPPERNQQRGESDDKRQAILLINNVAWKKEDLDLLKQFMASQMRSKGGPIASSNVLPGTTPGTSSVQIIYEGEGTAERVYEFYKQKGLIFMGVALDLELDLPWFTKDHDERKVRVSGLDNELDPETLKFYLSALSNTAVTEMFFNKSQTRAVAMFKSPIDYATMISLHKSISLQGSPDLKVQQGYETEYLIASGSELTREHLELPLESLLKKHFNRDIEVRADEYPDTPDFWKITTEPEALEFVLAQKKRLPRCDTLAPFSEFLGLHVTSGVHKKREDLANFVTDQRLFQFLLKVATGKRRLTDFLHSKGMVLSKDGVITINSASGKSNDRTVLKNWRRLKSDLEKFIEESFLTYRTDMLTQQVFDRLIPELSELFKGQPVVTDVNAKAQTSPTAGNQIAIAGEREVVLSLSNQLREMVTQLQAKIKEEKEIATTTVPNIPSYQMDFFNLIGFFKAMQEKHGLISFEPDPSRTGHIKIVGRPTNIDAAQREIFDLLPKINLSKVSTRKSPVFVKVLKTKSAESTIKQQMESAVPALWYLDNKTITVYSSSKEDSQIALDIITSVIWESLYPAKGKLDELERKLLESELWESKKEEMQKFYPPLEIEVHVGKSAVTLAGLAQFKESAIEDLRVFFRGNVGTKTINSVVKHEGKLDASGTPKNVKKTASQHTVKFSSRAVCEASKDAITTIVITQFPMGVHVTKLVSHFQETFQVQVISSHYDKKENHFVLEFSQSDAERILKTPTQLLDEDDPSTTIQLERLSNPIRDVLVTGEIQMNKRMLKKAFKNFGEVENVELLTPDKLQFVITFTTAEVAEAVAKQQVVAITPHNKVQVKMFGKGDSPEGGPHADAERILQTPTQLLDEDDPSTTIQLECLSNPIRDVLVTGESSMNKRMLKKAFKSFGEVENVEMFTPDKLQFVITFTIAEVAEAVAKQQVVAITPHKKVQVKMFGKGDSPEGGPHAAASSASSTLSNRSTRCSLPSQFSEKLKETPQSSRMSGTVSDLSTPFSPDYGSTPSASFTTSNSHSATSRATHVEVDLLPTYEASDLYQMLCLHFEDLFGEDWSLTVFNQSYDATNNIFRFDFDQEEIKMLMSKKQLLYEDDDSSSLTLRTGNTGKTVALTVLDNPGNLGLSRTSLINCFGMKSSFCSHLRIQGPYKNKANITLDTCSVAAQVVQVRKHTLDNKMVLEASFSLEEFPSSVSCVDSSSSEITDNVVLVTSAASKLVIQKIITTRTNGVLMNRLEEGKYLVEYMDNKAAKEVADQKVIEQYGAKLQVTLYRPSGGEGGRG